MSDARFEHIFRHSSTAMAVIRYNDGMYLDVNEQYQRLSGYSASELLGRTEAELQSWGSPDACEMLQQMVVERGMVSGWETTRRQKSGALRHVLLWAEPVLWDEQDALVFQFVDVTERKQADAQIHNYTLRAAALADISRALAEVSLDAQAVLSLSARVVARVIGDLCAIRLLSADGLWLEMVAMEHVRPAHGEVFRQHNMQARHSVQDAFFAPVLQSGTPIFSAIVDDSEVCLALPAYAGYIAEIGLASMMVLPLRAHGQIIGVLCMGRDRGGLPYNAADQTFLQEVADRVAMAVSVAKLYNSLEERVRARTAELATTLEVLSQANQNLATVNDELARAVRLKDEFLANISHELRTPLTTILGRAETLYEQIHGPLNDRQQRAVRSIEESGQHLLSLINDVLDLSRIETGTIELEIGPVNVSNLCFSSLRMITQAATRKQIAVSSSLDERATVIEADERRLRQVLVNLLSNAVKFTPTGGAIGLDVGCDLEQQAMSFTVWDTGIGIDPEDQQRLFQPFTQVDSGLTRRYEGAGLGLAMVARLVELHGGRVELESELQQGSQFRVILPWHHSTQASESPAMWLERLPPVRRALIVESLPMLAHQIGDYLRELGAQTLVHPMGSAVYDHARAMQPDVLVLNARLPDRSGWEVLAQLKTDSTTAQIPVVMMTVSGDVPETPYMPDARLVRPVSRRQFQHALYQAMSRIRHTATPGSVPLVLLAEDNEEVRHFLHDVLTRSGYCVLPTSNGAEAMRLIQEERPAVVLLDVLMPRMDGIDVLRRMRAEPDLAGMPVVCMSANASPDERSWYLAAGATGYLSKPIVLGELAQAMEQALNAKTL